MKTILSNDEHIHRMSTIELGGKGFYLAELIRSGFRVPPFFVVTNELFHKMTRKLSMQIAKLEELETQSRDTLLKEIQSSILTYSFSNEEEEEILRQFDLLLDKDELYASVRSSGGAEDGESASFAGQHETFLYVSRDQLLERIKQCMASAWSPSVVAYRMKQGVGLHNVDFAVIVQKMIVAETSGIAFSMNPTGNLADAIIVAGYGAGEGIVADKVESDTYLVNRQNERISKEVCSKKSQLVFDSSGGLRKEDVSTKLSDIPCLSDENIRVVHNEVMKAEKLLDAVADIEFCFDETGFWILQMRPVTTIHHEKIAILDNTNIVESYPGISLPLTFSFARYAYEHAFKGAAKAFWMPKRDQESAASMFEHLLGYHQNRIYYRLDNWYKMISLVFSSKKSMESWEKAVGLKRPSGNEVSLSFGNKLKVYASTVWRILNYKRGNKSFFRLFQTHYDGLRAIELKELNLIQLSKTLDEYATTFFQFWYLTLINDLMTFKSFDWVQKGIEQRELGSKDLANDLIAGIYQSESELAIVEVLKLKDEILKSDELAALFQLSASEVQEALESGSFDDFPEKIRRYIDRFGDRTLAELKLENKSFRHDPVGFIELLKGQLGSSESFGSYQRKQKERRVASDEVMKSAFNWWKPRSYFFRYAVRMAAYGTFNRENMRFCRTRIYGAVKDIYWEIGERFVEQKWMNSPEDIFYLTSEEVREACVNPHSLLEIVKSRREECEKNRSVKLPNRIIYDRTPPVFRSSKQSINQDVNALTGIPVSKGIVQAEAIIVTEPSYELDVKGKIIITEITDPGWVFLMSQARGLVSERGSLLSHTAIVGREMGIPVVVSVDEATSRIQSGDIIKIDGQQGTVEIMQRVKQD